MSDIPPRPTKIFNIFLLDRIRGGMLEWVRMNITKTNSIVFLGDTHFPFQDDECLTLVKQVITDLQPQAIVHLGDLVDFPSLSRFDFDLRKESLQADIDQGIIFFEELRRLAPKADIYWKCGNHDERLASYLLRKAPELNGLRCLTFESIFDLERLKIKLYREKNKFVLGDWIINHGWFTRPKSGYSGHASLEVSGMFNGISGHTHCLSKVYRTTYDGTVKCWVETGYLGSLKDDNWEYCKDRNRDWQQGFAVGSVSSDGRLDVDPISILDGVCVVHGKRYEA